MVFERLKRIFGRKKEIPAAPGVPELPKVVTAETTTTENMRAKMDLLLTQLESLNVRYETLNQRLANVERMVQEIYVIAKRP
jgi:phenylacetate-coenzyme A ligase PaaK-like adenylate-forming protein